MGCAGARVGVMASNDVRYLELLFACWAAGLVAVPMNPKLHTSEYEYMVQHSDAQAIFATPDLWDSARAATPPYVFIRERSVTLNSVPTYTSAECSLCRLRAPRGRKVIAIGSAEYERLVAQPGAPAVDSAPDAVAWLFYTRYASVIFGKVAWTRASVLYSQSNQQSDVVARSSGTTGKPKGASLTHRNLMTMTYKCVFWEAAVPSRLLAAAYPYTLIDAGATWLSAVSYWMSTQSRPACGRYTRRR
jgi:long-chain acyl-CoA synthetase